jgi:hypothetical protein
MFNLATQPFGPTKWEYYNEYDYEGSWVKRSLYRGNELTFIEVREIEYRDYEY